MLQDRQAIINKDQNLEKLDQIFIWQTLNLKTMGQHSKTDFKVKVIRIILEDFLMIKNNTNKATVHKVVKIQQVQCYKDIQI